MDKQHLKWKPSNQTQQVASGDPLTSDLSLEQTIVVVVRHS